MRRSVILFSGGLLSFVLLWFSLATYRSALPLAEENLHGLALSLVSAVEAIGVRDPSLASLDSFHPSDLLYIAMVDQKGNYLFHSNSDLIGTHADDPVFAESFRSGTPFDRRVQLGTGEMAFEYTTPLYLPQRELVLRLALHTFRADAVVRRARFTMGALLVLLATGWILATVVYSYSRREEIHRVEMARRERLAQLGEMGAVLAHEIRNPLAGIKGYIQMIGKKPQDARNVDFAQYVVAEVLRLEELVNELLAYAGAASFPVASIDPTDLITHTVALVSSEAEQQNVTLFSDCREGLRLVGNRDKLEQVLLNLAKNSLQAMPEGGTLRVAADSSNKNVIITMSDSGQGIPPEVKERIFDPFFTTKARGTGLGLALCKKFVEEHGGTISVESEPGDGTTVTVTIPNAPLNK